MAPITVLAGVCALLLGRRFFWLFVGIAGFAVGAEVAARVFRGGQPGTVILLIALAGGVVGAVLARWMQELTLGIVGALVGSYIGAELLLIAKPYPGRMIWLGIFAGGLAGVFLALTLFDWTLIVMSSLVGASLIVRGADSGVEATPVVLLMLAAVGIIAQASMRRRR
jgi:hypothetical protein